MTGSLAPLHPFGKPRKSGLKRTALLSLGSLLICCLPAYPQSSEIKPSPTPRSLDSLATEFWQWRARYQPFSSDDIPRMDHAPGARDWSPSSIAKQRATLGEFEERWKSLNTAGWTVPQQVDYRLIGSALARVRWELDINQRWLRDPSFYLEQTLTALAETLLQPPPFDASRSQLVFRRMEEIPAILDDAKLNLHPVRSFAELAIASLDRIGPKLLRLQHDLAPLLSDNSSANRITATQFPAATEKSITALESYRTWLQSHLNTMSDNVAVGQSGYEFFLRNVALLPYSPDQLLFLSRLEWDRSVAFETYERQRNQGLPELKLASSTDEEIANVKRDELSIRDFLEDRGILTVPANIPHYTVKPLSDYLDALSDFVEIDDFTSPARLHDDGVRWIGPPSPQLGYFWLATAKDPRPEIVHEGVPGHFFQLSLSRTNPDPIRRYYYDSGANEGIGFYAEEMMLQAGLLDDNPRAREIIYNFMRLRALRVEVDVKLALGKFTISQAANYLAQHVPMDKKTAQAEAAMFATTPGQAITYQVGKSQILHFLADAKLAQGDNFTLRKFHDFLWMNGNIPIVLQQWEYLGNDADLRLLEVPSPPVSPTN